MSLQLPCHMNDFLQVFEDTNEQHKGMPDLSSNVWSVVWYRVGVVVVLVEGGRDVLW